MQRSILTAIALIVIAISMSARTIGDMGMARDWCDSTMLHKIEGIWEFPDDQTRVLIKRMAGSESSYEIIVVETPDTRLHAGDKIGSLTASPLPTKFDMELYRNKKGGIFGNPGRCLAEFNESADALIVTSRKFNISLASRWFLPSFWKAIRIRTTNPTDRLPKGMIRIYPSPVKRQPDYL